MLNRIQTDNRYTLCSPYKPSVQLQDDIRQEIALQMSGRHSNLSLPLEYFKSIVPMRMERWGKATFTGGGDMIRSRIVRHQLRDSSFVRVSPPFVHAFHALSISSTR
jgi:hypothetical protein